MVVTKCFIHNYYDLSACCIREDKKKDIFNTRSSSKFLLGLRKNDFGHEDCLFYSKKNYKYREKTPKITQKEEQLDKIKYTTRNSAKNVNFRPANKKSKK